jgi:hypothetical protein
LLQSDRQRPAAQMLPLGQTLPQPAQLLGSICGLTHFPLQQLRPLGQTLPQAPQLFGSVRFEMHFPLQQQLPRQNVPPPQQAPPQQMSPAPHEWPHAPQLLLSCWRLVQAPSQQLWRDAQP